MHIDQSLLRQRASRSLTRLVPSRHAQSMTEVPGGTVGCDVCGVLVAGDQVSLHNEWHRTEDERFEGLAQTLRELVETVRNRPS